MDPQVSASFIPKKPLVSDVRRPSAGSSIFFLIGLLIFTGAVVLAGGMFLYEQYLKAAIQTKKDLLAQHQKAYDPLVINELIELDSRLKNSKLLMQKHIAPSAIFSFLERSTLSSVRFTAFDYSQAPNGTVTIALSGEAPDFAAVALQSDAFGQSRVLKDVIFSNINLGERGRVVFTVNASVDPAFIVYANMLAAVNASQSETSAPQAPAAQSAPATTTTP